MTIQDVQTEILGPMQHLFSPPRGNMSDAEIAGALAEYAESLERFSGPVLRGAWRQTRENHLKGTWPPLGVILKLAFAQKRLIEPAPQTSAVRHEYWPHDKYPFQLKPWREILHHNGRKIPHSDSPLAEALDQLQSPPRWARSPERT